MASQYLLSNELNALIRELANLRFKHYQFETLIGRENEHVELLNASAPSFFHMVHNVLWADILMHITRLTGPPITRVGGIENHNLTIQRLLGSKDLQFSAERREKILSAMDAAAFAKTARNKIIAHTDLNVALRIGEGGVTLGSREMLATAIDAIDLAIGAFFPFPIQKNFSRQSGGADDLLSRLQFARDKQTSAD